MTLVRLNSAAPIPVGHRVEVTEFADTRPEKRRGGAAASQAWSVPAVRDLDSGIRYLTGPQVGSNSGTAGLANTYGLEPDAGLPVARVWTGTVEACTLVLVEALPQQHTMLEVRAD